MTKKLAAIIILFIPILALAQRFLVKFSPGDANYPSGWPVEVSNPVTFTNVPVGWSTNWDESQISARISSLNSLFQSNLQFQSILVQTNRDAKLKLLADLFSDFQGYEDSWAAGTNFNAATMQVILRKHNGSLLLMKPMLKDLYDQRQ